MLVLNGNGLEGAASETLQTTRVYERKFQKRPDVLDEVATVSLLPRIAAAVRDFAAKELGLVTSHYRFVESREEVDAALATAEAAGGRITRTAKATDWGGYNGYFADPDGYVIELLLAQPVGRGMLFVGLYGGLALPLAAAFVVGVGLPFVWGGGGERSLAGTRSQRSHAPRTAPDLPGPVLYSAPVPVTWPAIVSRQDPAIA